MFYRVRTGRMENLRHARQVHQWYCLVDYCWLLAGNVWPFTKHVCKQQRMGGRCHLTFIGLECNYRSTVCDLTFADMYCEYLETNWCYCWKVKTIRLLCHELRLHVCSLNTPRSYGQDRQLRQTTPADIFWQDILVLGYGQVCESIQRGSITDYTQVSMVREAYITALTPHNIISGF
jgi:hypothetical protein